MATSVNDLPPAPSSSPPAPPALTATLPTAPPTPTRAAPQPPAWPAPKATLQSPLPIPPLSPTVEAFFTRNSLPPTARTLCWDFIASHYPSASNHHHPTVHECPTQGYCSYTLSISDSQIIQFRPRAHQLNATLALLAREVYGVLAPETRFLGVLPVPPSPSDTDRDDDDGTTTTTEVLFVYAMTRMPGTSLTSFRLLNNNNGGPGPRSSAAGGEVRLQRAILVRDFARFLATGWKNRRPTTTTTTTTTTSGVVVTRGPGGMEGLPVNVVRGRLGGSLRLRLEMMRDRLPARFRPVALDVLGDLDRIEALPWVLTHGDVVSDNIMVEAAGGHHHRGTGWWPGTLRGLIDWAESEYLPFGVGLYGVEELFGQSVRVWDGAADRVNERFAYYPEAGDLRRLFWQELEGAVPPLVNDRELRGAVEQARCLGILLWRGFAFDDGRIDRVVEEGRDQGEVQRLDMFLFGTDHPHMKGDAEVATAGGAEREGRREGMKMPLVTVSETEKEKEKGVPRVRSYLRRRISNMIM